MLSIYAFNLSGQPPGGYGICVQSKECNGLTHTHTHTHTHKHTHTHTRTHAHTRMHTHARTHTHTCTCTHARTHTQQTGGGAWTLRRGVDSSRTVCVAHHSFRPRRTSWCQPSLRCVRSGGRACAGLRRAGLSKCLFRHTHKRGWVTRLKRM